MHGRALTVCAMVAAGAVAIAGAELAELHQSLGDLERVKWLAGCWRAKSPRSIVDEHWMAPLGGTMVEMSRTVRGDSLADYELVVLRARGGRLEYTAHPSNQPMATFTESRVASAAGSIVFENPQHDFPQRVGYQLRGADSLVAWIDGTVGGKTRRVEFPYAKVDCLSP
jgi:hypothetical protein